MPWYVYEVNKKVLEVLKRKVATLDIKHEGSEVTIKATYNDITVIRRTKNRVRYKGNFTVCLNFYALDIYLICKKVEKPITEEVDLFRGKIYPHKDSREALKSWFLSNRRLRTKSYSIDATDLYILYLYEGVMVNRVNKYMEDMLVALGTSDLEHVLDKSTDMVYIIWM